MRSVHGCNRSKGERPSLVGGVVQLAQPGVGVGVAGHPPVATRRETDAAYLGSVGYARSLELIGEEPPQKNAQRVLDFRFAVRARECGQPRELQDAARPRAMPQHVVQKEIVQLVRAHRRFGELVGRAIVTRGQQFGRDWRPHNVEQTIADGAIPFILRQIDRKSVV